jgi:hypothetical protein
MCASVRGQARAERCFQQEVAWCVGRLLVKGVVREHMGRLAMYVRHVC